MAPIDGVDGPRADHKPADLATGHSSGGDVELGGGGTGIFGRLLYVQPDLKEHPAFKRTKLALLTIGVAVVLVANVTFLGFLTPPENKQVLLGEINRNFAQNIRYNAAIDKAYALSPGAYRDDNYDYETLSIQDYAATFTTIDPVMFCDNKLRTAFSIVNGCSFAFSLATLFLVAVLPVFVRRDYWDVQLAKLGSIFMTICLLTFITAFILAGCITVGLGATDHCDFGELPGEHDKKSQSAFTASVYTIVGIVLALVVIILVITIHQQRR